MSATECGEGKEICRSSTYTSYLVQKQTNFSGPLPYNNTQVLLQDIKINYMCNLMLFLHNTSKSLERMWFNITKGSSAVITFYSFCVLQYWPTVFEIWLQWLLRNILRGECYLSYIGKFCMYVQNVPSFNIFPPICKL